MLAPGRWEVIGGRPSRTDAHAERHPSAPHDRRATTSGVRGGAGCAHRGQAPGSRSRRTAVERGSRAGCAQRGADGRPARADVVVSIRARSERRRSWASTGDAPVAAQRAPGRWRHGAARAARNRPRRVSGRASTVTSAPHETARRIASRSSPALAGRRGGVAGSTRPDASRPPSRAPAGSSGHAPHRDPRLERLVPRRRRRLQRRAQASSSLGVPRDLLETHGAVSRGGGRGAWPRAPAAGLGADLAHRGHGHRRARPAARDAKPVGLTYVAVADATGHAVRAASCGAGTGRANKRASAAAALRAAARRSAEPPGA